MSSKARGFGRAANKAPQDPTKVPAGIDSSTFFAPAIPDEVRTCVPLLHITPTEILREALQNALKYLKGVEITDEQYVAMQKNASTVEGLDFAVMFTGLYSIIRVAVRQKAKSDTIRADLTRMNVPENVVEGVAKVVKVARGDIEATALTTRIRFPKLEKLRWRVDVIISSGSLSRVLRPTILMQVRASLCCINICC
jgi:hypothetical protein